MKVSIITACYNSSQTILKCIRSVNDQSYVDLEHIFIDGGSSDSTLTLIKNSNRKNFISSEPDKGIYDALNKGLALSTGDLIIFLHSDDFFVGKDVISDLVKPFYSDGNLSAVYGNVNFSRRTTCDTDIVRSWKSKPFQRSSLAFGWMPPHTGMLINKEIFREIGPFSVGFSISGDYDFILRFLTRYANVHYVDVDVTTMLIGGVSTKLHFGPLYQKFYEDVLALKRNKFSYPALTAIAKRIRKLNQHL